ncbi:hypothetical protein HRG_013827 [Hirsutella rhossiliensis]
MGMGREIEDQMKLETWTKVARKMVEEAGHFIIPLRWVYAYKLDEQGYVTALKPDLWSVETSSRKTTRTHTRPHYEQEPSEC